MRPSLSGPKYRKRIEAADEGKEVLINNLLTLLKMNQGGTEKSPKTKKAKIKNTWEKNRKINKYIIPHRNSAKIEHTNYSGVGQV